jgi:hypothetical protein
MNSNSIFSSDITYGPMLCREYDRFMLLNKIKKSATESFSKDFLYEIFSSIERFILAIANETVICNAKLGPYQKVVDEVYNLDFIDAPNKSMPVIQLIKEMTDKKVGSVEQIGFFLKQLIQYVTEFVMSYAIVRDSDPFDPSELTIINYETSCTLQYKEFKIVLSSERWNSLLNTKSSMQSILMMLLRYESMCPQGNQWGFSVEMYDNLYKNFNTIMECFSSPKNSQLLILGNKYNKMSTISFCSLHVDVDSTFGSNGSFFDLDILKFNSEYRKFHNIGPDVVLSIMVNPPYLEKLLNDTYKKIESVLAIQAKLPKNDVGRNLNIILNVPAWKDAEFYIGCAKHPNVIYKEFMPRRKHYYVNANCLNEKSEQTVITATFNSQIFVFGFKPSGNFKNLTCGYRL